MSYKYAEIRGGRKLSEMTDSERAYVHKKWDALCSRPSVNDSEKVFFQKPNGKFLVCIRRRFGAIPGYGCKGGYWTIQYGNCRAWTFRKNPFGEYDPEQADKYYNAVKFGDDEIISIPSEVRTKKEVLELAKKLHFMD